MTERWEDTHMHNRMSECERSQHLMAYWYGKIVVVIIIIVYFVNLRSCAKMRKIENNTIDMNARIWDTVNPLNIHQPLYRHQRKNEK